MVQMNEGLIDRIYEAAVIPELWKEVCDLVAADTFASSMVVLTISPEGSVRWVCSDDITEHLQTYEREGYAARNIRAQRGLDMAPGSFLRDIDILNPEELAADPVRNEFLIPTGYAWELGSAILEPSGSVLVNSLHGRTENGPFSTEAVERANVLKPDLTRATFLSARLAFKEAVTITQTLASLGLPAAVIGEGCRAVAMNDKMEDLAPRIRTGFGDRIKIADDDANRLLLDILDRWRLGVASEVQSIPVAATEEAPPLILHVVPVKRHALDVFSRSRAILIAVPVGNVGPPDLKVICGLFDLTRAEARVAREIAVGRSVEEVAASLAVGRETVRTHLKSVMRKTGVNRQGQLVALLSGLRRPDSVPDA